MAPQVPDGDEVEEGQLETPPRKGDQTRDRPTGSPAAGLPLTGSANASSNSQPKSRNRYRSRSPSRRRRSGSRSRRRRSASRSRSPFPGPVIRDMRRGARRGRNNRRPFRRNDRASFRDRRRSFSRSSSSSRSPSPRRGSKKETLPVERQKSEDPKARRHQQDADVPVPEPAVRAPRPEDIKNESKAETMSFLAMLNEKRQVNKSNHSHFKSDTTTGNESADGHSKSHGFVSTFAPATAGKKDRMAEQLDDGWEVVDDSRNSVSPQKRSAESTGSVAVEKDEAGKVHSSATACDKPDLQTKSTKSREKKKKSKSSRKEENKKKKRKDKKRKHSSDSSEDSTDEPRRHRKHKTRSVTPDTKSSGKLSKLANTDSLPPQETDEKRKKDRKKRSKRRTRSVSGSGSERNSSRSKKSKKKKSKKSQKKKKQHRKSSSESSTSVSSASESSTSDSDSEPEPTARGAAELKSHQRQKETETGEKKVQASPTVEKQLEKRIAPLNSEKKTDSKSVSTSKVVIGKMKQATSRRPVRSQDEKPTPLDMNKDYNWYQQYYVNSYALDPVYAQFYAQYAMIISGDYSKADLTAWLHSYGLVYDPNNLPTMPPLPQTVSETSSETGEKKIQVLVSDVPESAVEQFYQPQENIQPQEMDVVESDTECPTPPPPPPPPLPPCMTNIVVESPYLLPNGQEVPAGTKQVIVHNKPTFASV